MDGILLVDKASGWTSFDVVNKVRHIVATEQGKKPKHVKVGHTGTLDPLATGLLVLLLGSYCKRAQEFSKLDKTYEVTMRLGMTSTTGDEEGDKTPGNDRIPALDELRAALNHFTGEIMQTPPIFSAMKINGQRAYKLAREGKEVKLEPRPVTIHSLELTDYTYPEAKFTAEVSSGTYVRSLVEDLGTTLSTGAYMSALRRTRVGKFSLDEAIAVPQLEPQAIATHLRLA